MTNLEIYSTLFLCVVGFFVAVWSIVSAFNEHHRNEAYIAGRTRDDTKKKVIAIKLRKLAEDIDEIARQVDSLNEREDIRWSVLSLVSYGEIVNEWADEIEATIK